MADIVFTFGKDRQWRGKAITTDGSKWWSTHQPDIQLGVDLLAPQVVCEAIRRHPPHLSIEVTK